MLGLFLPPGVFGVSIDNPKHASDVELDRFELGKFLDGKPANLMTSSAFFESAKREFRVTLQK
jgi:hypothetical protein